MVVSLFILSSPPSGHHKVILVVGPILAEPHEDLGAAENDIVKANQVSEKGCVAA